MLTELPTSSSEAKPVTSHQALLASRILQGLAASMISCGAEVSLALSACNSVGTEACSCGSGGPCRACPSVIA